MAQNYWQTFTGKLNETLRSADLWNYRFEFDEVSDGGGLVPVWYLYDRDIEVEVFWAEDEAMIEALTLAREAQGDAA